MAVLGKGGMVRHAVRQVQTAEPSVGEVQMHLLAQPPFRADAEPVPDDQQSGIDGGAPRVAVDLRQMRPNAAEVHEAVDGPQQVVPRHMVLKRELVEQRRLRLLPRSHHRTTPPR